MKHLYIILFVLPLMGFGQGWEQNFGGTSNDNSYLIQQTSDGGYIVCGSTSSFGNGGLDVYLIKTDGNGIEEWSQNYGGTVTDGGWSIQQTQDGGYIICGETLSFGNGNSDVYLIKTDGLGQEQWYQTFGGSDLDKGISVQQTQDGGYIICGDTESFGNGYRDVYLVKTDEYGVEEWYQTFGGTGNDVGRSVEQTDDGGYIITGMTSSFGNGESDVYLIKTDGNGIEEWSQNLGGTVTDGGYSVQQTIDGGYIVCGYTYSYGNGNENPDVYLLKTDLDGVEEWYQTFGGIDYDDGRSVEQTSDGGYVITGYTTSFGNGNSDVYLIKTDLNGIEECSNTFGGIGNDTGHSVQQTIDGGYIVCGSTSSFGNGNSDFYLIKTDSECNITPHISTIELPIPIRKRELVKTTNILGQENTTIKNQLLIEIYDDGSTQKKIVIE